MLVYDITTNSTPPFASPRPEERLIRCVYDHRGPMSFLTGAHQPDGVHLMLGARSGLSMETVTNPIHHHITILTNNAAAYADVFNTKRFVVEYRRFDKEDFLRQRFPQWNFVGHSNENFPVIELVIT
jgi:hypothetical protein